MSDDANLTQPRLLTTREAAEILRVSPSTVLNWIGQDKIPYITLPGSKGGRREYRISRQRLLSSLTANYDATEEFGEADTEAAADTAPSADAAPSADTDNDAATNDAATEADADAAVSAESAVSAEPVANGAHGEGAAELVEAELQADSA